MSDILDDIKDEMIKEGQLKRVMQPCVRLNIANYQDNAKYYYSKQPFFYDMNQIFWEWEFGVNRYIMKDDIEMMRKFDKILGFEGQTISSGLKSCYLEAFKREGREHIPQNAPIKWIQFKDKAFSIKSGKIYNVQPNFFFTNPIPWEIGESSDCPTIDKLFTDWVGEEHKIDLYELIAYCTYCSYPIQILFCLFGSGRNGKDCFLKVLTTFLGQYNVTSTELDRLFGVQSSRFESFKTYKKLVCQMGETNFGVINQTSILKKLTGGSMIGYEIKNKTPFDDYNYAKIIINSNSLPRTEDTSDGMYRRWMIISFPNEFKEGKDVVSEIPPVEYKNLAKKVTEILPGLIKRGEFTHQGSIEERKHRYIMASNPLPYFIQEYCSYGHNLYMRKNDLYTAYVQYLSNIRRRRISRKEFNQLLDQEGIDYRYTSKCINGEYVYDTYVSFLELKSKNVENVANVGVFTPQFHVYSNHGEKSATLATIPTIFLQENVSEDTIEDSGIQKFNKNELCHIPCGYPIGDDMCGNTPCNEYNGVYICEVHFELWQSKQNGGFK